MPAFESMAGIRTCVNHKSPGLAHPDRSPALRPWELQAELKICSQSFRCKAGHETRTLHWAWRQVKSPGRSVLLWAHRELVGLRTSSSLGHVLLCKEERGWVGASVGRSLSQERAAGASHGRKLRSMALRAQHDNSVLRGPDRRGKRALFCGSLPPPRRGAVLLAKGPFHFPGVWRPLPVTPCPITSVTFISFKKVKDRL